jgi:hypothetical protein
MPVFDEGDPVAVARALRFERASSQAQQGRPLKEIEGFTAVETMRVFPQYHVEIPPWHECRHWEA